MVCGTCGMASVRDLGKFRASGHFLDYSVGWNATQMIEVASNYSILNCRIVTRTARENKSFENSF